MLEEGAVARYLEALAGAPVELLEVTPLGGLDEVKGFGYGKPLLLRWRQGEGERRAVLATVSPGSFGHQHMADRAALLLWNHRGFNSLPGHVRSLDVGGVHAGGELLPLGEVEEFFQLVDFADGACYADDLLALLEGGEASDLDRARVDALVDYLVATHSVTGPDDPSLYRRHVRELVGHSECIMGLIDSYPDIIGLGEHGVIDQARLEDIEHRCVRWRWKLHHKFHRLKRRHGDFHPWNILFRRDTAEHAILDRSRGEWGDPADDVVSLGLNYLFFALQREEAVTGPFAELYQRFWRRYLAATGDDELLSCAAPYVAFRALVMASPLWYPHLSDRVRASLFGLIERVLEADRFDWELADELARP